MKHHGPVPRSLMAGLIATLPTLAVYAQPQRGGGPELQDQRHAPMEAIDLPDPEVSITIEGAFRVIRANGLPDHAIGDFPNAGNPNALRPQSHEYRVPKDPKAAERPTAARPEFGVALNGVIFDSGTGEFWSADGQRRGPGGPPPGGQGRGPGGGGPGGGGPGGPGGPDAGWNYDAMGDGVPLGLDDNHAHVQPTGKYHYHGVPTGLLASLGQHAHENGHAHAHGMTQIGWALDGFPIYGALGHADPMDPQSELVELRPSYRHKAGQRPGPPDGPGGAYDGTFSRDWEYVEGLGDLDECNGRFGVTPEFPEGTYYYVVTEAFPSVPRFWYGEPGPSASRRGGPGATSGDDAGGPRRGGNRPPPPRR